MFVSVLSGVNKLYLFSHILSVWALIPEIFSMSLMLKTASVVFIFMINLGLANYKKINTKIKILKYCAHEKTRTSTR